MIDTKKTIGYENMDTARERPALRPSSDDELGRFGERVTKAVGNSSVRTFARDAGVDEKSLRQYMGGKTEPSRKALIGIARAGGVNIEWLATGEGLMASGQKMAYGVSENLADYAAIPLYEVTAAAGGGAVVEAERVVDFLHFKQDWIRHELHASAADLYLINVDGESMEPTLRPGDVILVDHRDQNQARDGIYVIRIDGSLLVKRLQKLPGGVIEVTSDNPAYKPFTIGTDQIGDDFAIIGRVVWSGRRM